MELINVLNVFPRPSQKRYNHREFHFVLEVRFNTEEMSHLKLIKKHMFTQVKEISDDGNFEVTFKETTIYRKDFYFD